MVLAFMSCLISPKIKQSNADDESSTEQVIVSNYEHVNQATFIATPDLFSVPNDLKSDIYSEFCRLVTYVDITQLSLQKIILFRFSRPPPFVAINL